MPGHGIAMIVHGGAWDIPSEAVESHRRGVEAAAAAGFAALEGGAAAIDALEIAVRSLEDDPTFDAGTGSMLNRDGEVELDAIVMRGDDLEAGAVAAVRRVRNPIQLARRVLENSEHLLLVGAGAGMFAREQGIPEIPEQDLLVERERERWEEIRRGDGKKTRDYFDGPPHGTVGAVAFDDQGCLAAGTSTGGTPGKYPGRVGDSAIVGCGCYCDDRAGGASATGYGESILRATLCRDAVRLLEDGKPAPMAAEASIARLGLRFEGRGGIILIDRQGRIGHAHNTPRMAVAGRAAGIEPFASV